MWSTSWSTCEIFHHQQHLPLFHTPSFWWQLHTVKGTIFSLSHIRPTALGQSFRDDTGSFWREHNQENMADTGDITCVTNAQERAFKAHVLSFISLNHIIKMIIYLTQGRDADVLILNIGMMTLKRWVRTWINRNIFLYQFHNQLTIPTTLKEHIGWS